MITTRFMIHTAAGAPLVDAQARVGNSVTRSIGRMAIEA